MQYKLKRNIQRNIIQRLDSLNDVDALGLTSIHDLFVFHGVPLLTTHWTYTTLLEPSLHAIQMKRM